MSGIIILSVWCMIGKFGVCACFKLCLMAPISQCNEPCDLSYFLLKTFVG